MIDADTLAEKLERQRDDEEEIGLSWLADDGHYVDDHDEIAARLMTQMCERQGCTPDDLHHVSVLPYRLGDNRGWQMLAWMAKR